MINIRQDRCANKFRLLLKVKVIEYLKTDLNEKAIYYRR